MNGQERLVGRSMLDSADEARILFMRPVYGEIPVRESHDTRENDPRLRAQALARVGIRYGGMATHGETTADLPGWD